MIKIKIAMEKKIRVSREFEVTEKQLEELKMGEIPFFDYLENELVNGDEKLDCAVYDGDGNTIVDWSC